MADVAVARPCGGCGTLVTMAGSCSEEQLAGICPHCGKTMAVPNDQYVAPKVCAKCGAPGELVDAPKPEPPAVAGRYAGPERRLQQITFDHPERRASAPMHFVPETPVPSMTGPGPEAVPI